MFKILPGIGIKGLVLSIKQSLRLRLKSFLGFVFSHNTHPLIHIPIIPPQKGFAPIALVILLLFGIAAGTLLVQNRTNFLPKADTSRYECDNNGNLFQIAPGELVERDDRNIPTETRTLIASCSSQGFVCNYIKKECSPPLNDQGCKNLSYYGGNYRLENGRCVKTPLTVVCDEACQKAGSNARHECDQNGNLVRIFSSLTERDDRSIPVEQRVIVAYCQDQGLVCDMFKKTCVPPLNDQGCKSLQYYGSNYKLENGKCIKIGISQPAAAAPAAPAGNASKVQAKKCTVQKNIDTCEKDTRSKGCYVIDDEERCVFEKAVGVKCNSDEGIFCKNVRRKKDCEVGGAVLLEDNKEIEVEFTKCTAEAVSTAAPPPLTSSTSNAAATAPRGNQAAPAQAASTAGKSPWDIDSDGDSAKVEQVLERAAKATSGPADNATDGIDAAKKVRSAYEAEFKKAYADIFKADIAKDADALNTLNKELNNVSVHAYVSKENPNKNWNTAKSDGTVQKAIDHLKQTGVIPQSANISASSVSTPGQMPGGGSADPGCGVDSLGLSIPCFKIGVFSPEELQATERDARVALARYDQYRAIINEYDKNIKAEIKQAALVKIAAAEEKAKACLERK